MSRFQISKRICADGLSGLATYLSVPRDGIVLETLDPQSPVLETTYTSTDIGTLETLDSQSPVLETAESENKPGGNEKKPYESKKKPGENENSGKKPARSFSFTAQEGPFDEYRRKIDIYIGEYTGEYTNENENTNKNIDIGEATNIGEYIGEDTNTNIGEDDIYIGEDTDIDENAGKNKDENKDKSAKTADSGEKGRKSEFIVTETCDFKLAVPVWRILLAPLVKRTLKKHSALYLSGTESYLSVTEDKQPNDKYPARERPARKPQHSDFGPQHSDLDKPTYKNPWWAPSARIDRRFARVLSLLCLLSIIGGYLGTLLSQTITFVGDEFEVNTKTQGYILAAIRVGVVLAFFAAAAADKYGRRRLIGIAAVLSSIFTLAGAASVDIFSYSIFQAIARALATSFVLLLGIMAAEEAPSGARAYSASVLSLSAALGAGVVVWLLPVADTGEAHWRILYLVPALGLVALVPLLKALPETTRFLSRSASPSSAPATFLAGSSPVRNKSSSPEFTESPPPAFAKSPSPAFAKKRSHRRLALLGITGFFLALFAAPASQFQNEFLRDERGFSGIKLTLFQLCTNTPAGLGIFAGGKLADLRGRRLVGAIGLLGGTLFVVFRYLIGGWTMWMWGGLAATVGASIVPVIGVYSPELFATARRGRFGGLLAIMGVAGSAAGLALVGYLSDSLGSFGKAFAVVAIAPLIVVFLVIFFFPETANTKLEDLNPEDQT